VKQHRYRVTNEENGIDVPLAWQSLALAVFHQVPFQGRAPLRRIENEASAELPFCMPDVRLRFLTASKLRLSMGTPLPRFCVLTEGHRGPEQPS
jgi:hypothetical protein